MIKVVSHPLLAHKLSILRDKETRSWLFRSLLNEITNLMAFEVFRSLETEDYEIDTPVAKGKGKRISNSVVILPILRAGISMVEGMLEAYPLARVGHIGLERDENNFKANSYYYKMPANSKDDNIYIVDPMLATGGSAHETIKRLKEEGYKNITLVCIIGVEEGVAKINSAFPEVNIYLADIDPKLTERKYISPGLGDAGDRFFGTTE